MVRPGVVLYGLSPSPECAGMAALLPAMSLYTTVTMVKTLDQHAAVSYGRRYVTPKGGATDRLDCHRLCRRLPAQLYK